MPRRSRQNSGVPSCARDVAQAVVAGDAAAELHLRLAGQEVELVVHDQDLLRRDREEARERRDRAARLVHVRRRLQRAAASPRLARPRPRNLRFVRERRAELRAQARRRTRSPRCAACASYSRPGLPRPTTRRIGVPIGADGCDRGRPSAAKRPAGSRGGPSCRADGDGRLLLLVVLLAGSFLSPSLSPPFSPALRLGGLGARPPARRRGSAFGGRQPLPRPRRRAFGTTAAATTGSSLPRVTDGHARRQLQRRHVHRVADVERPTGRPR